MPKIITYGAEEALSKRPSRVHGLEEFTLGLSFEAIRNFYFGIDVSEVKPAMLKLS